MAEYRMISQSRMKCGCECIDGNCTVVNNCECAKHGINCQVIRLFVIERRSRDLLIFKVDKTLFPCHCSEIKCQNPEGRVVFDQLGVHSHYVRTIMRLKEENQSVVFYLLSKLR